MSLNNKETQGSGSKVLRSNLSKVFKAALDDDLTLDGQAVDDTDLEEPSIVIEDLSDIASSILSNRAPTDLTSPEEVANNSSRILSHVFSMSMGKVDFESLKQTMQAARIESGIENILSRKILERMYQADPEKIDYLLSKISGKHSQIYSKIKKLGFEADALYNMILRSSKSEIIDTPMAGKVIDYSFLDQNIKDIFMSVYSGSFSPAMFLRLHEDGLGSQNVLNLKSNLITDYSKVLKEISGKALSEVDFHNYCRTPAIKKHDLTWMLYQLLHDISFSLNHGLSPYVVSRLNSTNIQPNELEKHLSYSNSTEAPYLSDLGWNGNYNILKNTGYLGYQDLFDDYTQQLGHLEQHDPEAFAKIKTISLPFPDQNYVPTAHYNHTSPNRSPAMRAKEWIDSGSPGNYESCIERTARVAACLSTEFQLSRGYDFLPPMPTKGSPIGRSIFGEMNHNIYNLTENSSFYDYPMTSGIVPKPKNKPFYFYEKAIRYKDSLGSGNNRIDFTTEFVGSYTSEEERKKRLQMVDQLESFLNTQDEYVKNLWNTISSLNDFQEISYVADPSEQPSQGDAAYASAQLRSKLTRSINPEKIMSCMMIPFDVIYDKLRSDSSSWPIRMGDLEYFKRNSIVAQTYALCFMSKKFRKDDINSALKDRMRRHVVQGVINRDIARSMDNSPVSIGDHVEPVPTRRIGYTKDLLNRQTAIIQAAGTEGNPHVFSSLGETDNQKFSVGDLLGWTVNKECNSERERNDIGNAVRAPIFRSRNQIEFAAKAKQKDIIAYICGAYHSEKNPPPIGPEITDALANSVDVYDSIIAAVDQIDRIVTVAIENKTQHVDNALSGSKIHTGDYFDQHAGITKASGLDRSLLISIVVDCISEILGTSFFGAYIREWDPFQNARGVYHYEKGGYRPEVEEAAGYIPETIARIELLPRLDLDVTRPRYDFDMAPPTSSELDPVEYDNGVVYDHTFFSNITFEKCMGMLSALGSCLNPVATQVALFSNRVQGKQDLNKFFRNVFVDRMTESPSEFHGSTIKSRNGTAALEAFKNIMGPFADETGLLESGESGYKNFYEYHYDRIENYLLSHRASLKAVTEFVTLHGSYVNSIRAFVDKINYIEEQFKENNPEEWYTSLLTKTQVYKSIQNLSKQYSVISAAPDEEDNFLFRETVRPEMWKAVDLFLDQKISETTYDENRNYVFYGTTPCSFYGYLSFVGDTPGGIEGTSPTVDGIAVTAQITNPLDETIEFEPSDDTEFFISTNLFLDEGSILSVINSGVETWEALREQVLIIPGRQMPGISEVSQEVRSDPASYLSYVRENHGFTLGQFRQNDEVFPYLDNAGVLAIEEIVDNLLKSFCMRFIGETLYSLTLDPSKIFWEKVTSSLVFPPEDSGPGTSFMNSYRHILSDIGVDLRDLEEKLLTPAWETFVLAKNPQSYELMGTKDRISLGVDFEKLLKPRPIINSQGEAKIVPPQINDEEIYVADCIFSSLLFQNLSLRFGTPLFEEMHVLEFGIEKTEGDPRWESVHHKYLKNVPNLIPHDGLTDMAKSRTLRVVSPRVEIIGE